MSDIGCALVVQSEREARVKSETECDVVRLAAQQESHAALRAQHLWTSEKEASPCYTPIALHSTAHRSKTWCCSVIGGTAPLQ